MYDVRPRQGLAALTATRWDFLIVGAGIAGLSLAEALVHRSRARVLILEAERVGAGASTRNAGRLTHAGCTTPVIAEHARDCRRSLRALETRIRHSLLIQPMGEVTVLYRSSEVEHIRNAVLPSLRHAKLDGQLISAHKVERLIPGYTMEGVVAGFHSRASFVVHHDSALFGLLEYLTRSGVVISERSPVDDLLFSGQAVCGVQVGDRDIEADNVVLCSAGRTVDFLAGLDLHVPLTVVRQQTLVTEPIRNPGWPIVRWTGPESSGGVHRTVRGEMIAACQHPQGDPTLDNGCTPGFLTRTTRQLARNLPPLRGIAVLRQWGGVNAKTADHMPYAGQVPSHPGLWTLFGMNAFTMYPLVADRLATTLLGMEAHPAVAGYALSPTRGVRLRSM